MWPLAAVMCSVRMVQLFDKVRKILLAAVWFVPGGYLVDVMLVLRRRHGFPVRGWRARGVDSDPGNDCSSAQREAKEDPDLQQQRC